MHIKLKITPPNFEWRCEFIDACPKPLCSLYKIAAKMQAYNDCSWRFHMQDLAFLLDNPIYSQMFDKFTWLRHGLA
jgi:hypothetical protein